MQNVILYNIVYPYKNITQLDQGDPAICDNTDEPEGHYARLNKPDTERKTLCDLTHVRTLETSSTQKEGGTGVRLGGGVRGEMPGGRMQPQVRRVINPAL